MFDKTGTLTKGTFSVTEVIPANGYAADDVLKYAAFAEYFSNHPAAKSIKSAYGTEIDGSAINNYTEISGHGVKVETSGVKIAAGNEKLMDMLSVAYDENPAVGTKVFVAVNSIFAGCIVIADEIKSDSKDAVLKLRRMGVQKTVMLTGDNEQTAKTVAEEIGIDEYHACLLPDQKVDIFEKLDKEKQKNMKIAFVGDGINDAPVLARADIGIAMGALGSDAAIEAADVVLMTDELSKLSETITVANATKSIVMQNIIMAIGVKILFLILGALGYAGMWVAVFGDVGVMLLAVINAMRILKV